MGARPCSVVVPRGNYAIHRPTELGETIVARFTVNAPHVRVRVRRPHRYAAGGVMLGFAGFVTVAVGIGLTLGGAASCNYLCDRPLLASGVLSLGGGLSTIFGALLIVRAAQQRPTFERMADAREKSTVAFRGLSLAMTPAWTGAAIALSF